LSRPGTDPPNEDEGEAADVADGGTVRIVLPTDEDGPTISVAIPSDDDLPTMRISTEVIAAIESNEGSLDPPTIKIAAKPVREEVESEVESTVDLTRDALPDELLRAALPFVPPITLLRLVPAPPLAAPAIVTPTAPAEEPSGPSTPSLDVAGVAKIAAELADKPRAAVLSRHGVDGAVWSKAELGAIAKIAEAIGRHDFSLRDAFDASYLEARAERRGPFGRETFARLQRAISESSDDAMNDGTIVDVADAVRFRRVLARR
jgi:hypothetical protein